MARRPRERLIEIFMKEQRWGIFQFNYYKCCCPRSYVTKSLPQVGFNPSKTRHRMSQIYSSASYQRWWKFNKLSATKKPRNDDKKLYNKKTIDKVKEKSIFFLWKHVFSNSIFDAIPPREKGRIFNEKVIWSIYFKLVRLFTEISRWNFLCQIWILFSAIKINCWQFFARCASSREKKGERKIWKM